MIMNREQLEEQLNTLAKEAIINEHIAVASIIYALLGSMIIDNERALMDHVTVFVIKEQKRLSALNN